MQPGQTPYRKYRVVLSTPGGSAVVAAADSVNDLVGLTKAWLETTSAGSYLPDDAEGTITVQVLNPQTGAYYGGGQALFADKEDIITQLRKLGGR